MRYSHGSKLLDEGAEIGLSSLVIFISTITISGIVASLMVGSTVLMTEGIEDSLDDVISSMYPSIEIVSGYVVTNYTCVQEIWLKVQVSHTPVDITVMMIEVFDGDFDCNLSASDSVSNTSFKFSFLRDLENATVLEYGDLASIQISLLATNQTLLPSESLEIVFYPLDGSLVGFSYTAPEVLGMKLIPIRC